jgi:hypothetical protein
MRAAVLNVNCPSTRTRRSRPFFSNSQTYRPRCAGNLKLMQLCCVSSCGVRGAEYFR